MLDGMIVRGSGNEMLETGTADLGESRDLLSRSDQSLYSSHNFVGSKEELFRLTSLALGHGCLAGSDHIGAVIEVKFWFVHEVSRVNNHGEVETWPRTVLITPEGKAYSFGSHGVFDSVKLIAQFYGRKPLDPALKFRVVQLTTANKNRLTILEQVTA